MAGYSSTISRNRAGSRQTYVYSVDGSAARQEVFADRPAQKRKKNQTQYVVRKRKASFGIWNLMTILLLSVLLSCCMLLMVAADVRLSAERREIASLQAELTQIQEKNASLRENLYQAMDLNELYRRATKDLGMVYPDESQIVYYSDSSEDYVRQFADIPDRD